jgi:hypothetical protein
MVFIATKASDIQVNIGAVNTRRIMLTRTGRVDWTTSGDHALICPFPGSHCRTQSGSVPWGISPNSLAENTYVLKESGQSLDFKTKKNGGGYT